MTFTYDIAGAALRDKLRLHIGDTGGEAAKFVFHDEELDTLLALDESDLLVASARACRIMATDAAKRAIMLTMPGVTITSTEISRRYMELADKYEAQAAQRVQPQYATIYGETDVWFDSIVGRGDVELDVPLNSESAP